MRSAAFSSRSCGVRSDSSAVGPHAANTPVITSARATTPPTHITGERHVLRVMGSFLSTRLCQSWTPRVYQRPYTQTSADTARMFPRRLTLAPRCPRFRGRDVTVVVFGFAVASPDLRDTLVADWSRVESSNITPDENQSCAVVQASPGAGLAARSSGLGICGWQ